VLDFGQDEAGRPYMAMELLRGEELGRRLERVGRLGLDEVKVIVAETCKALTKAHAAGFIHRDLKPANIKLRPDGTVKVLDFGLAKARDGGLQMTGAGELVGTPHFMSPEQARGKPLDHRTDLYSLGVVTYQCLTGHLPFGDKVSLPDLLLAIVQKEPPLASVHRPDLPAGVVTWLYRSMQKDPASRFSSAKEMAETFKNACEMRRMVVSVPSIGGSDDEPSAHGEDITMRAGQAAIDMALSTRHGRVSEPPPTAVPSTEPDAAPPSGAHGMPPTERAPSSSGMRPQPSASIVVSGRPTQPSGGGSFHVERTLPMGASSDQFAAARASVPDAPPESVRPPPYVPPQEPMRAPSSGSGALFYVALAVVVMVAGGALYFVTQHGPGAAPGPGSAHSAR
jgi:serine/threonine-protein kinase